MVADTRRCLPDFTQRGHPHRIGAVKRIHKTHQRDRVMQREVNVFKGHAACSPPRHKSP